MKQLYTGLFIALIFVSGANAQAEKAQEEEKSSVEKVTAPQKTVAPEGASEKKAVKEEENAEENSGTKKTVTESKSKQDSLEGKAADDSKQKQVEETPDAGKIAKAEPAGEDAAETVEKDTTAGELQAVEEEVQRADSSIEAESSETGTLTIITVPDSAVVVFDDDVKGKSPIVLNDIIPGKHTIILKKKGYFVKKATVNVTAGSDSELTFELVKPVHLSISSEPAGATVSLNKKQVGKTPFVDGTLKPGTYDVSITLAEYKREQHAVTLESGEKDSMHVTLMPLTKETEDTTAVIEERKEKKEKSKLASILDKVALGLFVGFSIIILVIELTQDK